MYLLSLLKIQTVLAQQTEWVNDIYIQVVPTPKGKKQRGGEYYPRIIPFYCKLLQKCGMYF